MRKLLTELTVLLVLSIALHQPAQAEVYAMAGLTSVEADNDVRRGLSVVGAGLGLGRVAAVEATYSHGAMPMLNASAVARMSLFSGVTLLAKAGAAQVRRGVGGNWSGWQPAYGLGAQIDMGGLALRTTVDRVRSTQERERSTSLTVLLVKTF